MSTIDDKGNWGLDQEIEGCYVLKDQIRFIEFKRGAEKGIVAIKIATLPRISEQEHYTTATTKIRDKCIKTEIRKKV